MKTKEILFSVARYVSAIILAQTLFFKFTGAAESVYIFTAVGMEPWGRIGVGIAELIAAILLVYKRFSWVGAGLSIGMMSGAIMMHLLIIGIEVMDDGGELFFLALTVLLLCGYVFYQQRTSWLPFLNRK
jgi:uncharacterized membrane protein YphA (DoxX/SURF4 family)